MFKFPTRRLVWLGITLYGRRMILWCIILPAILNTIIRGGSTPPTGPNNDDLTVDVPDPYSTLATVGSRYQPWGLGIQMDGVGNDDNLGQVDKNQFNLAYRDPLAWGSDYGNFRAGKFPNAGWFGRVHRGTPWQTLYLKATNIFNLSSSSANGAKTWAYWTGNTRLLPGNRQRFSTQVILIRCKIAISIRPVHHAVQ